MIKEEKICSACGILKSKEEFVIKAKENKLSSKCKKCKAKCKGVKERFIKNSRVFCIIDMAPKDKLIGPKIPKYLITEKQCATCGETKNIDEFEKTPKGEYNYRHSCKKCVRKAKTISERKTREKAWGNGKISLLDISVVKSKFKKQHPDIDYSFLTVDWYSKLIEEQNECCAICKKNIKSFVKRLVVDHCHKTGKVRGLLCHSCNTAIGNLRDNVEILKSAIDYIENPPHYKFDE